MRSIEYYPNDYVVISKYYQSKHVEKEIKRCKMHTHTLYLFLNFANLCVHVFIRVIHSNLDYHFLRFQKSFLRRRCAIF